MKDKKQLIALTVGFIALVIIGSFYLKYSDDQRTKTNTNFENIPNQINNIESSVQENKITPKETSPDQSNIKESSKTNSDNVATTPPPTTNQNPYPEGTAAWYVYQKRTELELPISALGSLEVWPQSAKQKGFSVSRTPTKSSIAHKGSFIGFVEAVNLDGSVSVSHMSTYNTLQSLTIPVSETGNYWFLQ